VKSTTLLAYVSASVRYEHQHRQLSDVFFTVILGTPKASPPPVIGNGIKLVLSLAGRRPSTSLRYAQGERGGGENRGKFPFVLSVAA